MPNIKDKLALLTPAMIVSGAVAQNLPDTMVPDPEGLDPSVVQSNEMCFRIARTIYAWLCQSWADETLWQKPPEGVSKLELLTVSAHLTAGIVSNLADELPLDPSTADPKTIQQSAAVWRVWRTIYAWLCLSLADDVMWVPVPEGVGAAAGGGGGVTMEGLVSLLSVPANVAKLKSLVMG